jgi:hypothetical protein
MNNQPKQNDYDDGRVICNMDVDGMRWHDQRMRRQKRAERKVVQGEQMTPSESRLYTWYSVLAALLIVGVFSVTWILFTLFCTKIWFR